LKIIFKKFEKILDGICSYHVFRSKDEEFPFAIDIKDQDTGEAIIQIIKNEYVVVKSEQEAELENSPVNIVLDCNKKKEFNFLIQAHDCSTPSLASRKIPVKIQVVDHDDYPLKFEQRGVYAKTLVESDGLYKNFMSIKARDLDCTNNGYACSYKLLLNDLNDIGKKFPFKIDSTGSLSTVRPVKSGESHKFKVRAFDCITNDSFAEAKVFINIAKPCVPQFFDYATEVAFVLDHIGLFESLKTTSCQDKNNGSLKKNDECSIDSVSSVITLKMDNSLKEDCSTEKDKCTEKPFESKPVETSSRFVLFSADEDLGVEDENIEKTSKIFLQTDKRPPYNFKSFSKISKNSLEINFDGKFGSEFTLSAWLRRKPGANKNNREQVLCGTDSKVMNRHHFGLYFYRGNLKFLLRKEHESGLLSKNSDKIIFYPSLWEWALSESLLTDSKWHYYEVKFSYPNAVLFIDGQKFAENTTNSDIIDAYELSDDKDVGSISSYIGACYHGKKLIFFSELFKYFHSFQIFKKIKARTKTLLDHFEGDIGSVVLVKKKIEPAKEEPKCRKACDEYIELNIVGIENYRV
jgi:hypothetical protein